MASDQVSQFTSALNKELSSFGIEKIHDAHIVQLSKHYSMLCRWNHRLNLTRVTEPGLAARLHYAESLFGESFIEHAGTILDIGSGAGFPAIPLAVARPDVQVSALEANGKKSLFLKEARDELGLMNLKVIKARLEDIDWSGYELLTSRALDHAETVFSQVIEHLSSGQRLMLYCGPELIAKLEANYKTERHQIPHSEARFVAIFSSE